MDLERAKSYISKGIHRLIPILSWYKGWKEAQIPPFSSAVLCYCILKARVKRGTPNCDEPILVIAHKYMNEILLIQSEVSGWLKELTKVLF